MSTSSLIDRLSARVCDLKLKDDDDDDKRSPSRKQNRVNNHNINNNNNNNSSIKTVYEFKSLTVNEDELDGDYQPILEPIICCGDYDSREHYLRVHYGQLREDLTHQIRNAIVYFRQQGKMISCLDSKQWPSKLKGRIFLYRLRNIRIEVDPVNQKKFYNVTLQATDNNNDKASPKSTGEPGNDKRLIQGSLLYISKDGFQTYTCFTIHKRLNNAVRYTVYQLKQYPPRSGKINYKSALSVEHGDEYICIETGAFFGAYSHTLTHLSELMESDNLVPFFNDILQAKTSQRLVPKFAADESIKLCMTSLMLPVNKLCDNATLEDLKTMRADYKRAFENADNIELTIGELKDAENFSSPSMDKSQFRAIKHALAHRVALIQGPPGTGKTHVAVQLVRFFLVNKKRLGIDSPILIVAQTNNAIDQLLERLMPYAARVVRVGRDDTPDDSTSLLKQFNLGFMVDNSKTVKRIKRELDKTEMIFRQGLCSVKEVKRWRRAHYNAFTAKKKSMLCKATIVGLTLTGASKYREHLKCMLPQVVVVEEAALVFEASILPCLTDDIESLIMIGDHEQLRPRPQLNILASKYHLDISLFERLTKNDHPYARLTTQHRMRPEISSYARKLIYSDLMDHASVLGRPEYTFIPRSVVFLSHNRREQSFTNSTSFHNAFEVELALSICRVIIKQGIRPQEITILSMYDGQQKLLVSKLQQQQQKQLHAIEVHTVDSFQGRENNIIIVSCVRGDNKSQQIGFISQSNRLNVALTRARLAMLFLGNFKMYARKCSMWSKLLTHARQHHHFVEIA